MSCLSPQAYCDPSECIFANAGQDCEECMSTWDELEDCARQSQCDAGEDLSLVYALDKA